YRVRIGTASRLRAGREVTLVATSWMVSQALIAARRLADAGVDVEVIDLRSIKPWDTDLVLSSVRETGRLVVADAAWTSVDMAATSSAVAGTRVEASPARGEGRGVTALRVATAVIIGWGALAFGAVYPWAYAPLLLACAALGVVGLVRGTGTIPVMFAVGL